MDRIVNLSNRNSIMNNTISSRATNRTACFEHGKVERDHEIDGLG